MPEMFSESEQPTAMAARDFARSLATGTGFLLGASSTLRRKAGLALAMHVVGTAAVGSAMLWLERQQAKSRAEQKQ